MKPFETPQRSLKLKTVGRVKKALSSCDRKDEIKKIICWKLIVLKWFRTKYEGNKEPWQVITVDVFPAKNGIPVFHAHLQIFTVIFFCLLKWGQFVSRCCQTYIGKVTYIF